MKRILNRKNLISGAVALAVYVLISLLMHFGMLSRHYQSLLVPVGINVILAVSLNLTVGFLGELTLGHAGFMSVGAYAGCLFTLAVDWPVWIELPLAMLLGGLVASLFGILIGIPALRLKGDYLAIVTLAFGEIIRSVITNLDFLGGADPGGQPGEFPAWAGHLRDSGQCDCRGIPGHQCGVLQAAGLCGGRLFCRCGGRALWAQPGHSQAGYL